MIMQKRTFMTSRGAYVDAKGVRWDTNDADFEGYLYKQSRWVRGECILNLFLSPSIEWRKRFLILKGSKIFFSRVCVSLRLFNSFPPTAIGHRTSWND
jgi:hypothetical protein